MLFFSVARGRAFLCVRRRVRLPRSAWNLLPWQNSKLAFSARPSFERRHAGVVRLFAGRELRQELDSVLRRIVASLLRGHLGRYNSGNGENSAPRHQRGLCLNVLCLDWGKDFLPCCSVCVRYRQAPKNATIGTAIQASATRMRPWRRPYPTRPAQVRSQGRASRLSVSLASFQTFVP